MVICLHGTKSKDIEHFPESLVSDTKYDSVTVVHFGTNGMRNAAGGYGS